MKEECAQIIDLLNTLPGEKWAEEFVNLHMRFWRKYCLGLIFSTIHGADFFSNILDCLNGKHWEPDKDEPVPGEYEENFRKFIKHYRKQYERH